MYILPGCRGGRTPLTHLTDLWFARYGEGFRSDTFEVADNLEYSYPEELDRRVTAYVKALGAIAPGGVMIWLCARQLTH